MIYFNHFISPGLQSFSKKSPSPPIWFGLGVRLPSELPGGVEDGGWIGLYVQPQLERREPGVAGGGSAPATRTPRRAPSAPVQQAAAFNICFQSLLRLTRAATSQAFAAVRGLKGTNPTPCALLKEPVPLQFLRDSPAPRRQILELPLTLARCHDSSFVLSPFSAQS